MRGVKFDDQNCVFGKPSDMSDEECYSLPVKKTKNGGFNSLESVWELSESEIELIIKSKRIRLGIIGEGMPPVYLIVEQEK